MRIYFKDDDDDEIEGELTWCPECGGDAIHNDSGTTCLDENCPSNQD